MVKYTMKMVKNKNYEIEEDTKDNEFVLYKIIITINLELF